MLKYYNYDIVFQEIPDEVTFAINITNCPNRCKGCHSPHLQRDIGQVLDEITIDALIKKYSTAITCFCFMGGDNNPAEVARLTKYIRKNYSKIKVGWYSGCADLPQNFDRKDFQYIKLGGYKEEFGNLKSNQSNQKLFEIQPNGEMRDISAKFYANTQTSI